MRPKATIQDWLRGIAGGFVLLSVALGWFVHPAFFLFTAFVGANLLQSAMTRTCPMWWLLGRLGVPETAEKASPHRAA
jgi:small-conductance mechanosensitive channel